MDTRPRNLPANYCLQQREYKLSNQYAMYQNSANGIPLHPAIPTLGYTPSHMNRGVFSHNPVQIESSLFGINANNLVNPQPPVYPELKELHFKPFFETLPLLVPAPLAVDPLQRPFPVP